MRIIFFHAARNDFADVVWRHHPEMEEVAGWLNKCGSHLSLLSGSGSTVFGIFLDHELARACAESCAETSWQVYVAKTYSR